MKYYIFSAGFITVSAGIAQYIFYPSLGNLLYLGWDPHFFRIFGFILDPNFFGIILILFILFIIHVPVIRNMLISRIFLAALIVMLGLTFSRSSYLALIFSLGVMLIFRKNIQYLTAGIFLIISIILIVPKPAIDSLNILRIFSAKTRIENFSLGLEMFSNRPVLGYGYNAIRYAKARYLYDDRQLESSRSGAGFDNSFMTVAVSSGLIGLIFFLYLLYVYLRKGNSLCRISLFAVLIHSLFTNSFFYPFVWYWLLLIFPLGEAAAGKGKHQGI